MRAAWLAVIAVLCTLAAGCGGSGIQISAAFDDVGDLVERSQVQYADVRVGTVTRIELDGYMARVHMDIDASAEIPNNVGAVIRSTSLLGEKFVELVLPAGQTPTGSRLSHGDHITAARTGLATDLERVLLQLSGILEGGTAGDLATFISSSAEAVRGREEKLGELIGELRRTTDTLRPHAADLGLAIDGLSATFDSLAASAPQIAEAIDSTARVTQVVAGQQEDLDRLLSSLDRFSSVAARYTSSTTPSSDRALDDLRLILDEVMKTTDDLDRSLSALSRFVDLWPRAVPGDHVQLDVVVHSSNENPAASAGARDTTMPGFVELLWGAIR